MPILHEFPYGNTHDQNYDWILQVVKEMLDKYQDIDTHVAEALAQIEAAKTSSLEDMQTALENALSEINEAISNIGSAETSALQNITDAKTGALTDIATDKATAQAAIATDQATAQAAIATDKQAAQSAIATDQSTAQAAIATDQATAQAAIATDKQAAQSAIATYQSTAQAAIASDQSAALLAIQNLLTSALASINNEQISATQVIQQLYNTLPADSQSILGQLQIIMGMLNNNYSTSIPWIQCYFTGTDGIHRTLDNTYLSMDETRTNGCASRRMIFSTETGYHLYELSWWHYSDDPTPIELRNVITFPANTTYYDYTFSSTAAFFSITVRKDDLSVITPQDAAGNITIEMLMNAVNVPSMIAFEEADLTADIAHTVGTPSEYFLYNGALYRALKNIPQYGTIVISGAEANCEETTIAEELQETNDAIADLNNALDNIDEQMDAITTSQTLYHSVENVISSPEYTWSTNPTYMTKLKVEQNNRVAVEFACKPNTKYIVRGQYAGTNQNYGIGFFTGAQTTRSFAVLYNATQETWNGYQYCTIFTTPSGCNYVRYTAFPRSGDFQKEEYKDYTINTDAIPVTIQRVTDNSLQTTSKTVTGAINEINSMIIGTSSVPWVVAPNVDPTTDMTSTILSCLTSYGICQLMQGTYVVTNLDMPNYTTLMGVGRKTVISLSGTDSTTGYAIKMATGCAVKGLRVIGSSESITLASSLVNRHGILWQGTYSDNQTAPHRGTIENVFIERFKGGGITCHDTGTPTHNCINVTDVYIVECRAGINVSYSSEFNRFENVHCYGCYYGCVNNGGNNTYVNCSFSSNTVGFIMGSISDSITLSNTQHGSAIGCVINHSHANNGTGIKIDGGSNGFIFSGCQLFYSAIDLDNTSGIVFDAMNIGAIDIHVDDCSGAILFSNCMFGSAPTVSKSNSPNVVTANCYVRSTGASVTI